MWPLWRILGFPLVLFVLAIYGFEYFAIVGILIPELLTSGKVGLVIEGVIDLIVFHAVFGLALWSYWRIVFSDPGYVQTNKIPSDKRNTTEATQTQKYTHGDGNNWTFCTKCNQPKPPRTHHCSLCKKCVMRMDHHCPWVNNCVGFENYKWFFLFVNYATLGCLVAILIVAIRFASIGLDIDNIGWRDIVMGVSGLVGLMFAFATGSMASLNWILIRRNSTQLEDHYKGVNPYNLGSISTNMTDLWGTMRWKWWFPISDETRFSDGYSYSLASSSHHIV